MTLVDSTLCSVEHAILMEDAILGDIDGRAVEIPLDRISTVERHEVDGFDVFVVTHVAALTAVVVSFLYLAPKIDPPIGARHY